MHQKFILVTTLWLLLVVVSLLQTTTPSGRGGVAAEVANTTTPTVSVNITASSTQELTHNTSTQELTQNTSSQEHTQSNSSEHNTPSNTSELVPTNTSELSASRTQNATQSQELTRSTSESENATATVIPPTPTHTKLATNTSELTKSASDGNLTQTPSLNLTQSKSVEQTLSESHNGTETRHRGVSVSKSDTRSRSPNATDTREQSSTRSRNTFSASESEHLNSSTIEPTFSRSPSEPSPTDTFTKSESVSETLTLEATETPTDELTPTNETTETVSQTDPSPTRSKSSEPTLTDEETISKSETVSHPSESHTDSRPPTPTDELTESRSLSFTTFSDARLVIAKQLPRDGALGFTTTHAPELVFEGAPQLRVNGSERWVPARKVWPKDFDLPMPDRRCRAFVVDVASIPSSSSPSLLTLPAACSSSPITTNSLRVVPKTDSVPASFGACRFDSFTVDWTPGIASCLQHTISNGDVSYRTPEMNITVRFCLNTSKLSAPMQHLPRLGEMCVDSWTVINSCPLSRENLLYTVDSPITRLSAPSSSGLLTSFSWTVEGTWFHPAASVVCRVTDNSGQEVFRQAAKWVDTCRISCLVNASSIALMQQVTTLHSTIQPTATGTFLIAGSLPVPGFAGALSLERDGYLFVSACPGLTSQTVSQLNEDALSTGVNCRFTQAPQYRLMPTTSVGSDGSFGGKMPSGCPVRLVGRPQLPSFFPPSGTILAPVLVSDSGASVHAMLQGTVEVTFCDLAGNRAFLEDAVVGPKSLSSVSIDKTQQQQSSSSSSSTMTGMRNQTSTAVFFINTTFEPVTAATFDNRSAKCNTGRVEDIPLVFNPPEYFGWETIYPTTTSAAATTSGGGTATSSPPPPPASEQQQQQDKILGKLAYCVTYDADIPTSLKIDNENEILTVGDTDVGMPVVPIISATNRIGKLITGSVTRFRVRLKAELLLATTTTAVHNAGIVFDQLVNGFPVEIPVRFNQSGTGYGLRVSLAGASGNTSSSIVLWGSDYPAVKNISISFCTTTGNPPPFVQSVLAEYSHRQLCGKTVPSISLYDSLYQNATNSTTVTVFGGSFPYTMPVYCQFSNVDTPWSFTTVGSRAKILSSCRAECVIPPQRFPIRALSAFAFNASGSWVSTRTLSSPPGMLRLKVGSSWIGPISMDVYGVGASLVLLSFPQNLYIRLQTTILVPVTVTVADAATNSLAGLDTVERKVYLSSDEGTAVLLNGTSQLQGMSDTCAPDNGVASLRGITFLNPQAGEYKLLFVSPGLHRLSTAVTLRNPDPKFGHYLRFGGKTPPLQFTDPSSEGTTFGTFPVKLHVEACVRGTTVPDTEVSGFGIIVRINPIVTTTSAKNNNKDNNSTNKNNNNAGSGRTAADKARGIGLTGCEPTFGNCEVSERGVVVFDVLRFFGEPGMEYNLTVSMSNATLDVYPLWMIVRTPQCDIGTASVQQKDSPQFLEQNRKRVIPDRMGLSNLIPNGIAVKGKYFPIPRAAFSGWWNTSELEEDRYFCSFAGARFPAMFVDTCTVRCFMNDVSFFSGRRLANGTSSASVVTSHDPGTAAGWPWSDKNVTLPPNISLCSSPSSSTSQSSQSSSAGSSLCCFDKQKMSIVCTQPVASLVQVIYPERFNRLQTQAERNQEEVAAISGGSGTLFVVGSSTSAVVSQPPSASKYKIFERDQIVPVDPRTAEVRLAPFDLLIVDSVGQELFAFDTVAHHVVLEKITRRGKPLLGLPANWSAVERNTVPSDFIEQNLPGSCLEKIPGSAEMYYGAPVPITVYHQERMTPSFPSSSSSSSNNTDGSGGGGGGGDAASTTMLATTSSSSLFSPTSSSINVAMTTTNTASAENETTTSPPSSSSSSSSFSNSNKIPVVTNISGIRDEGWYTANGSLRIEDLVLYKPSAGTYDLSFRIQIGDDPATDVVYASFALHVVGGEPTDVCMWTFGGRGLRNPLNGIMQPQPMFMFLDAAGNIYQPLRQNPNLTNYLDLIDETFVRSVKEIPHLLFRSKLTAIAAAEGGAGDPYADEDGFRYESNFTNVPAAGPETDKDNNGGENNNNQVSSSSSSSLSYEIPELEFIEPQGIGLLTYMFRSFRIRSNFSYDFKLDFRSTSRLKVPAYWRNFNKTIVSPIFESEDCPATDYAIPETADCRGCPSGPKACIGSIFPFCFICNGTTTSLVEKSYWRFAPESTVAYFCSKSTCQGPSVLGTCDERSIPHSPMCQVCSPGYSKALDGGCADCGERWVSVVIVIVTVIIVAVVVALIVTASLKAHEASSSSSVVIFSKVFVNFLQVLGMLGEFGVGFPGFVKATLMGVSIGSGAAGIGLNPIYCLFPDFTFFHVLVLHLVLPIITLLVLAAILLLRGWLVTRHYRKREQAKLRRAAQRAAAEAAIGTTAAHHNVVPVEEDNQIINLFDDDVLGDGGAEDVELKTNPNFVTSTSSSPSSPSPTPLQQHEEDAAAGETNDSLVVGGGSNIMLATPPQRPTAAAAADDDDDGDAPSLPMPPSSASQAADHGQQEQPSLKQEQQEVKSPAVTNQSMLSSTFRSFRSFFLKNNKKETTGGGDGDNNGNDGGDGVDNIDDWSDDEFSDADLEGDLGPPPPMFQGRIFLTCAIIIMFLLYQSILTQTVDTFRCDELRTTSELPEISFMQADPRVPCVGTLYEKIVAIAAWGLFLYGVVVPLASLIAILHTARHQGWSVANEFFAFLINGFRLECWYWELVIVFRKVVIRFLLAMVEDDMLQALLGVWFLTAMFIIHAYRSPYVRSLHNNAESLSLLTTIMVLNFGMLLQRTQEMTQEVCGTICRGLSLVLVLVLALIVFFFCANIVRSFYDHLIESLGVDRPDGRKVIVWRNVKRAVKGALGGEEKLPANFSTYEPPVLEPHVAEMLGTNQSDTPPK